ncbi:hypothetical protein EL17_17940 [Anditalea andensis]|uniref:DUF5683 domain-containing protein n=1 Tax=Anditalea andensis TaxID=1048983 RepID=A0A074KWQ7_9BACT|nr:hypothetical protein EL17_17940 [Anditalea andensis]
MVFSKAIAVFVLIFIISADGYGQVTTDTTARGVTLESPDANRIKLDPSAAKDPTRAALLSAILPGAGQVYNNKMWKVPIIYGGIITNVYFLDFNSRRYLLFRDALQIARNPDDPRQNPFPNLNEDGIIRNVNYWRRNRDLNYMVFGIIYAINIVDSLVDAHLSGFDISDDLSLDIRPSYENMYAGSSLIGLSVKLKF